MSTPAYPHERWMYPVTMDSGNASVAVTENGGAAVVIDLDEGEYYVHTGTDGLLKELVGALNTHGSLSGAYSIEAITPRQTRTLGRVGMRLKATGLTSLSITVFSGFSTSRPALEECLGLGRGGAFDATASGSALVIDSPFSCAGHWVPFVRRTSYEPRPGGILRASTDYPERDDFYALDYGTRRRRFVEYEYLPSTRIFVGRATRPDYAAHAEEGEGDEAQAFEWLWRCARRGDLIYATHYGAGEHLTLDAPNASAFSGDSESMRLADLPGAQDMMSMVSSMRLAGELYRVRFEAVVVASGYTY